MSDQRTPRHPSEGTGAQGGAVPGTAVQVEAEKATERLRDVISEQLGIRGMIREYMIPVDTNTIWYSLGGVLAISLMLEILSGIFLAFRYVPAADRAFQTTEALLNEGGWSFNLSFHYWNSYVIFGLVMIHMLRVFFSGAYRLGKKGLWEVGVALAGVVFLLSLTGETLHWDERGFAVPWHVGEFFEAIGLANFFHWSPEDLLNVHLATGRLTLFYAFHIAVLPILLLSLIAMHYYLVKVKHISLPFWHKPTGGETPFTEHIKAWLLYSALILGPILLISIFIHRAAGDAPQLLASSPFHGPGFEPGQVVVPTFPISWTHGMNRFVSILGLEPDIWGTVIGMVLMTAALAAIPYLDRQSLQPTSWGEALHGRTGAFVAMGLFWLIMIIGTVTNAVTPVG